jgi:glucose-6-phosphate 1-dehydrogenase
LGPAHYNLHIGGYLPERFAAIGLDIKPTSEDEFCQQPGSILHISPVAMNFSYQDTYRTPSPEAYETLLADVMLSDATLFMLDDQVEASWTLITPILNAWNEVKPLNFPNYQSGTWGPEETEVSIAQDGLSWMQPAVHDEVTK